MSVSFVKCFPLQRQDCTFPNSALTIVPAETPVLMIDGSNGCDCLSQDLVLSHCSISWTVLLNVCLSIRRL